MLWIKIFDKIRKHFEVTERWRYSDNAAICPEITAKKKYKVFQLLALTTPLIKNAYQIL